MESTEEFDSKSDHNPGKSPKKAASQSTGRQSTAYGKAKRPPEQETSSSKYCMLHGLGSHATDDCITLKNQAKRMKGAYAAQTTEGKRKFKKREELHNLVVQSVEKALKSKAKALDEYQYDEESTANKKTEPEDEDFQMEDFDLASLSSGSTGEPTS